MNKVIKNEAEYREAMSTLERLLDGNPAAGTPESDEIELLTLLVQDYEARNYVFAAPDPIEAIKFRMEHQGLTPRDLIPYIGSRSKVSEVLSGKRTLTMSMIRALHSGLQIPASVLIQEGKEELDWERFPIKEMAGLGWIALPKDGGNISAEAILRPFFETASSLRPQAALYRTSGHVRSARPMDDYALRAWSARVLILASRNPPTEQYKTGTVTMDFLRNVAKLSRADEGPIEVRNYLDRYGIQLVVERHLSHTYLDGAAVALDKARPVIGITLRYDRIDSYWFTLMHELAHVSLHLEHNEDIFYDDLDVDGEDDPQERQANDLAGEALIPSNAWEGSAARHLRSPQAADLLARELGIHPAIVAGRMRREFKAYQLLTNLVGNRQVRRYFPEVNWR